MSFFSDLFGGGDQKNTVEYATPMQLPDYPEAEGARKDWYNTLQQWSSMPNWGATGPNWNDIWENAKRKVTEYYRGGPGGPGAIASEGNTLQDLAVKQAIEEANVGNRGRETWLGSLQSLAGQKPSFQTPGYTQTIEGPGIASQLGSGFGGVTGRSTGGGDIMGMMSKFANMFGLGDIFGGGGSGLGRTGGFMDTNDPANRGPADYYQNQGEDDGFGAKEGIDIAKIAIPILMSMFCWVAAEVFGESMTDSKTSACRYYIGNIGPRWFKNLYMKHGEDFAKFIHNKPIIKAIIKPLFEFFAQEGAKAQSALAF